MKPLDLLQGKWLGHPLHPVLVHIPMGLWIAAGGIDVANAWRGHGDILPRVAFYCVLAGLAVAALAVLTGLADWAPIKRDKPAWKLGLAHMLLNIAAIAMWAINLKLRIHLPPMHQLPTVAILATSISGVLLLFASGYIGSLMVFDQGTGVARYSKKKWRDLAKQAGSHVAKEE